MSADLFSSVPQTFWQTFGFFTENSYINIEQRNHKAFTIVFSVFSKLEDLLTI